ncbi:MAG: TIGR04283 family arsenosugar biosynthesis glycosyltransferase [Nitrospinota bacterium]|nr:TIGR04283 family arsenosugar biosynthesis glycosyltransferase [Nitrospinota bacterium]MDH5679281.1 TIGR04283 family arsenosugar biosynthesis glycosyltransferase [Nitrospinota bacterium]
MTHKRHGQQPAISIIIPAFEETGLQNIAATFADEGGVELVFALAPDDRISKPPMGAKVAHAPKGRASQMNAGAWASSGQILLFLHADTRIPPESLALVRHTLARPNVAAGAYSLRVEGAGIWYKFISTGANLRSRWLGMPFGDQAIFMTRDVFHQIGGYEPIPILEDVRIVEAAARYGKIAVLPAQASTSARRWETRGRYATWLRHWGIMIAYKLGVAPQTLARWFAR